MADIRIILVDDHQILRDGVLSFLARESEIEVVAVAADGREAVRKAQEFTPDVVVMDILMPELSGMEATRQILAHDPQVRVLALSMHSAAHVITEMLEAGAKGYVLKSSALEDLPAAIRTVAAGHTYLSPPVADTVVRAYLDLLSEHPERDKDNLSAREREVLQLIAEGVPTREIAAKLHVSTKTVEAHRSRIKAKLGIDNLPGLTKYAIAAGMTSQEI